MEKFILALDQGTTNSRAMVFDHTGRIVSRSQDLVHSVCPHPGEVEQDPHELWGTQLTVAQ